LTRGLRGATTVTKNKEEEILYRTQILIEDMVKTNNIEADMVSHVFISVTADINAVFPAQALRRLEDWTFVPVMCMREIDVPSSLEKCIRVMMVVNTDKKQEHMKHIFHNEAVKLRPDLLNKKKGE